VAALLEILFLQREARLFAEADRAIKKHELKLLGRCRQYLCPEITLCRLGIHGYWLYQREYVCDFMSD
jgi:hypothetical protein